MTSWEWKVVISLIRIVLHMVREPNVTIPIKDELVLREAIRREDERFSPDK